jgi:tetratricopeptide (TPR) repeat protein
MQLEDIQIATPCKADWNSMKGDEKQRYCDLCHLNVYNISAMSRQEAEAFLQSRQNEGRTCVRLFRRSDGTVITEDCPVGLRRLRDAGKKVSAKIAAALWAILAVTPVGAQTKNMAELGDFAPEATPRNTVPAEAMGGLRAPPTNTVELSVSTSIVSLRQCWLKKHRDATANAIASVSKAGSAQKVGLLQGANKLQSAAKSAQDSHLENEAAASLNNAANCLALSGDRSKAMATYKRALSLIQSNTGALATNGNLIIDNMFVVAAVGSPPNFSEFNSQVQSIARTHAPGSAGYAWIQTDAGGAVYTRDRRDAGKK